MSTLQVITVSTRKQRFGPLFAAWFVEQAKQHGKFDVEPVDLAQVNLPLFDEPNHPRMQQYEHEHTKAWSATVQRADAFVFVMPEYNHSAPPSIVNALNYLCLEWAYKPVGFVSYGGLSGGSRGVESLLSLLATLKLVPMVEAVNIPFFGNYIDKDTGILTLDDRQTEAAANMLNELLRWTGALQTLRG